MADLRWRYGVVDRIIPRATYGFILDGNGIERFFEAGSVKLHAELRKSDDQVPDAWSDLRKGDLVMFLPVDAGDRRRASFVQKLQKTVQIPVEE